MVEQLLVNSRGRTRVRAAQNTFLHHMARVLAVPQSASAANEQEANMLKRWPKLDQNGTQESTAPCKRVASAFPSREERLSGG